MRQVLISFMTSFHINMNHFIKAGFSVNCDESSLLEFVRFNDRSLASLAGFLSFICQSIDFFTSAIRSGDMPRLSFSLCDNNIVDHCVSRLFLSRDVLAFEGLLSSLSDEVRGLRTGESRDRAKI
jgi:hypothetical protein